ncbi:ribonuclease H-like domain-containing protein, partial [Tanacetum coccineum]
MDDLYNNLKVYEPEVKGMSSSSSSTQNMAFVSSSNNNTSSTNEAVNTAHGVSTASTQVNAANSINIDNFSDVVVCALFASQVNSPQLVHEDLQQIHPDDMEEMDLRWHMAMLIMRARRDILLGSVELQEIKTTMKGKLKKECACGNITSQIWCHVMVLVDMVMNGSDQARGEGLIWHLCFPIDSEEFVNEPVVKKNKAMYSKEESKDKGVINSGCSRHMTGNMSYLTYYEEIDGGYVAFGGTPKEEKSQEKGNLVRGLPSKLFENDQTCVACQKGKQHRASFVTDDYSRFTWVFFLATKDETSGILKSFISGIENLVDHKVKMIRCDNGTEFKNKEMNQFCEMKGILRQYSVARTPQQNEVAERKNRTLIEVVRTMLADSKLLTTFWAEAVNTACYVQNRVLVVKHHNKTPYELFHGRTPTLSFMRPFGCPVTILNTIDHLVKFDGKVDEGFFVGYSLNSKAFRVSNSITRTVKENLHIRFSESTPNVVGTKASNNAGQARKEIKPVKNYILLPLWPADPPFSQDPNSSQDDGSKPSSDDEKKIDEDPRKDSESIDQEKDD